MTSAEIQVDISDPEGVLGVIRSLYNQLQELNAANQSLIQMNKARNERIQATSELSEQLTEKLNDLLSSAQTMEAAIEENAETTSSPDQELQDLLNEKERLDAITGGHTHNALDADLENEQRLNGFVEEELARKIDELSNLQERLADVRERYKNEWELYKTEIKQYEIDKSGYEEKVDHLQELKLAKFVGAHSGVDRSNSTLIRRLVDHHLNLLSHRELQRKLTESRVLEKDLETEIGDLVKQKQLYWKRCLDLERCLEEIQDTSDETNMLRPTSAYLALPDVNEGVDPTSGTSDLDIASEHNHGRMLHRCHKNINLVADLSTEEREEMEESIQADIGPNDTEEITLVQKESEVAPTVADDNEEQEDNVQQSDTIFQSNHNIDSIVEEPQCQVESQVESQVDEATSSTTEIQLPDHIRNAIGHAEDNISFVTKLRKRVGLSGRSSSSQRIKGTPKLTATSSTRNFAPGSLFKRKK